MSNASGDDELDKQHFRELVEDVRDALNVTCDAKALHSLTCLESLFGRIKEERDRLKNLVFSLEEDVKYSKCDTNAALAQVAGFKALNVESEAELGRIREAALTPREASAIIDDCERRYFPHNAEHLFSGLEKLRFISGGALKEGNNND